MHSEMGPVRQNAIQRTVRTAQCSSKCAYDCAQLSVHNTAQNSSDNLPSYLQTTIIAQMLSIGGKGGAYLHGLSVINPCSRANSYNPNESNFSKKE